MRLLLHLAEQARLRQHIDACFAPTKGVPVHVLSAALYERFSSRSEADFPDELLSVMRHQFGASGEASRILTMETTSMTKKKRDQPTINTIRTPRTDTVEQATSGDLGTPMALAPLGKPSVTLDDIRRFRQLDSKAPDHPEYRWGSGGGTTTGPLGLLIVSGSAACLILQAHEVLTLRGIRSRAVSMPSWDSASRHRITKICCRPV